MLEQTIDAQRLAKAVSLSHIARLNKSRWQGSNRWEQNTFTILLTFHNAHRTNANQQLAFFYYLYAILSTTMLKKNKKPFRRFLQ